MFVKYKPFIITFLLCLMLFGGLLYASLQILDGNDFLPVDEVVEDLPKNSYAPEVTDNVAVALMLCNDRAENPVSYFFLKFDVVQGQLFVVEVPENTLATVNTSTKTISEFYQYGGMEFAASAIGNLFLQSRCYYVRADAKTFGVGVDALEGISYTLKEPIQTARYTLPAGQSQLDGNRIADLLLCDTFYDKADLLSALCSLRFNDSQVYRLDTLYNALFACDTDINGEELTRLNSAITYGLRMPLTTVTLTLMGVTEQGKLTLDSEMMQRIYKELAV